MNKNNITVVFDNNLLNIDKEGAQRFRLRPGDTITSEEKFWQILRQNTAHMMSRLRVIIEAEERIKTNSSKN